MAHRFRPLDAVSHAVRPLTSLRPVGLALELAWWEWWLLRKGWQWPEEYRRRLDPERPLAPVHRDLLAHLGRERLRILDVGSGPLSEVGRRLPGKELEVVAVDPLGRAYTWLLRLSGLRPLVPVVPLSAEDLSRRFPPASFDLVQARNAIDHSRHPRRAIREMLRVVRPGCYVYLQHRVDEAESREHSALHQWNFRCEDGCLVLWGQKGRTDLTAVLAPLATVECRSDGQWVTAILRRHDDSPPTVTTGGASADQDSVSA
ncbi:MAG: class I SAM-dependent methyltransferase [Dehalococcoidia bacterium]|nr:class I SAM-dependent methyltransferase [Dehalococcoidia bacterium]